MMPYDRRGVAEQVEQKEETKNTFWNGYYTLGLIAFFIVLLVMLH
jgi:hypothetical protein